MANGSNVHVTSYLYSIRFLKTRRKFEMCVCGWVGEGGVGWRELIILKGGNNSGVDCSHVPQ